jgi:hypothetical protein
MKRVFEAGFVWAQSNEEPRMRPIHTSIDMDSDQAFWVVMGAAEMSPSEAEQLARQLLIAANIAKARAMNLAGSVTV